MFQLNMVKNRQPLLLIDVSVVLKLLVMAQCDMSSSIYAVYDLFFYFCINTSFIETPFDETIHVFYCLRKWDVNNEWILWSCLNKMDMSFQTCISSLLCLSRPIPLGTCNLKWYTLKWWRNGWSQLVTVLVIIVYRKLEQNWCLIIPNM